MVYGCTKLKSITLPAFSYYKEDENGEIVNVNLNDPAYLVTTTRWVRDANGLDENDDLLLIDKGCVSQIEEINLSPKDNGLAFVSLNGVIYSADKARLIKAPWKIDALRIESETNTIETYAFHNSNIVSVEVPENLTTVGTGAFNGAYRFVTSEILKNLTSIGASAFEGTKLSSVTIGSGVNTVSDHAFNSIQSVTALTFNGFNGDIDKYAFADMSNLKTIIVSCDTAPKLKSIKSSFNGGFEEFAWYQFNNAGLYAPSGKKLLVSVGTKDSFLRVSGDTDSDTTYVVSAETSWVYLTTKFGFEIAEEIPLTGICEVKIYHNGAELNNSVVYANTSLGHELVGIYDDGSYMFNIGDLYDNEEVFVYLDAGMTELIGTFRPRISSDKYQIGVPSLGSTKSKSLVLSATSPDENTEMAEITKEEYDSLVLRVNQLVKIIKKLAK